jgi:ADP-heptose:LPS heptosyltransferase
LGFPHHFFQGTGGIGDDLLSSCVFHELKKRGSRRIAFATTHPSLYDHKPDVDEILPWRNTPADKWLHLGLPFIRLGYANYNPATDRDEHPDDHILAVMCRLAGLQGSVDFRPYLHLTPEELAAGKITENQVAIQSSGLSAAFAMRNKEWFPHRFQEVCSELSSDVRVVQIGSKNDPKLEGTIDLRGKTTIRESAAILANSLVFIGLVGFLMHLARAVDCRSVILYGGRETPAQTGYIANQNLYTPVKCAPCWFRNNCDYDHKCMSAITVEQVINAAAAQITRYGTPLEVQTAKL